jgi:hypothetical protein
MPDGARPAGRTWPELDPALDPRPAPRSPEERLWLDRRRLLDLRARRAGLDEAIRAADLRARESQARLEASRLRAARRDARRAAAAAAAAETGDGAAPATPGARS